MMEHLLDHMLSTLFSREMNMRANKLRYISDNIKELIIVAPLIILTLSEMNCHFHKEPDLEFKNVLQSIISIRHLGSSVYLIDSDSYPNYYSAWAVLR